MAALYQDPPSDAPAAPPYECRQTARTSDGDAGRGLFALRDIAQGERVHLAHCILVPKEEYQSHCRHTVFEHYLFNCRSGDRLLALGDGSLFNHARKPNIDYRIGETEQVIRYYACKPITAGEELCINYGNDLWFEEAGVEAGEGEGEESEESEEDEETDGGAAFRAMMLGDLPAETLAALNAVQKS